jgi:hypothetical protein
VLHEQDSVRSIEPAPRKAEQDEVDVMEPTPRGNPFFLVSEAQHQFLGQAALLMKSLSPLLPFAKKHRPDRD